MNNVTRKGFNLASLNITIRSLFTGYLLVIGIGLLVAGGQILLTHGMADGKFGLSVDDIVYSYYGDRESSKLENKLHGSMQDKAPRVVRQAIIKWVREGADKQQWEQGIKDHFANNCVKCHGVIPGLPNFNTLAGVLPVAHIDQGASISSLTRVSHIHLFGIAFIFFFVGLIFSLTTGISTWIKTVVIVMPFIFLMVDVLSWWLTKIHPSFAWLTIISGLGYTFASIFMWFSCLVQMWWYPYKGKTSDENAWFNTKEVE
jgi:hypothetical protein